MHKIEAQKMQKVIAKFGGEYRFLALPDPQVTVMDGVCWGHHDHLLTPAFWASRVWMEGDRAADWFRLGETLSEEVVACLLGGYGIPAEVGLAAFERVREKMQTIWDFVPDDTALEALLRKPLIVNGKKIHYRFARQKARYVAACLQKIDTMGPPPDSDLDFREWLLELPGIGYKTASWIVRNWRASDEVAIIDIHVVRACLVMGVFPSRADPSRHYLGLEKRFLDFAFSIGVRASILDAVIWRTMKRLPFSVRGAYN